MFMSLFNYYTSEWKSDVNYPPLLLSYPTSGAEMRTHMGYNHLSNNENINIIMQWTLHLSLSSKNGDKRTHPFFWSPGCHFKTGDVSCVYSQYCHTVPTILAKWQISAGDLLLKTHKCHLHYHSMSPLDILDLLYLCWGQMFHDLHWHHHLIISFFFNFYLFSWTFPLHWCFLFSSCFGHTFGFLLYISYQFRIWCFIWWLVKFS